MDPIEAQQFYANPENQIPAGQARRRIGARLSGTVPVRFPQAVIDAVKRLADRDGITVSSWIRRLVIEEVMRRQPAAVTEPSQPPQFEAVTVPSQPSVTDSSGAPDWRVEVEVPCLSVFSRLRNIWVGNGASTTCVFLVWAASRSPAVHEASS